MRIAKAIEAGFALDDITRQIDEWIDKTKIFVDIHTLKYMVRGGRVKSHERLAG